MYFSVEQNVWKNSCYLGCLILGLFSCKPKLIQPKNKQKERRPLDREQYSLDSAWL
jgi:hypothetical protein